MHGRLCRYKYSKRLLCTVLLGSILSLLSIESKASSIPMREQMLHSNKLSHVLIEQAVLIMDKPCPCGKSYEFGSYEEKRVLEEGDSLGVDGWNIVMKPSIQSGCFVYTSYENGGSYNIEERTVYVRAKNGRGYYDVSLKVMIDTMTESGQDIQRNNVNAWFYSSTSSGYTPFDSTTYMIAKATRNPFNAGDYDYDCANERFIMNKGKGAYDVLFKRAKGDVGQNIYYMMSEYEIVDDCTGQYSGELGYRKAPDRDRDGKPDGHYNASRKSLFYYVGEGNGFYSWVAKGEDPSMYWQEDPMEIWVDKQIVYEKWFFRIK